MEEGPPLVAKFYRPARWSDAQILEEHSFSRELADREIPVVAPLVVAGAHAACVRGLPLHGVSAPRGTGARAGGSADARVDRAFSRPHPRGRRDPAIPRASRARLDSYGVEPREWLLASGLVPAELVEAWTRATALALEGARRCYERAGNVTGIRLHGDCHARQRAVDRRRARISWTSTTAARGRRCRTCGCCSRATAGSMARQLADVLAGYEEFQRIRSARTAPGRGAAHPAPDPLFRVDRAALGRSRVSRRVSLVRHPALLAGPHSRAARADRGDGGRAPPPSVRGEGVGAEG